MYGSQQTVASGGSALNLMHSALKPLTRLEPVCSVAHLIPRKISCAELKESMIDRQRIAPRPSLSGKTAAGVQVCWHHPPARFPSLAAGRHSITIISSQSRLSSQSQHGTFSEPQNSKESNKTHSVLRPPSDLNRAKSWSSLEI